MFAVDLKKMVMTATVATGLMTGVVSGHPAHAEGSEMGAESSYRVETVAHRGASGYAPENTMAAFEKAVEMKTDYIEIDVQMSKDGELVVIHDTTVDRTTDGTGKVGGLTMEELKALDAGSWFAEGFAGEPIPTFEEVLDTYRGKTGILIELKAPWLYPGIEEKVAAELQERQMDKPNNEKIILQSFDFNSMKKMNELLPDVPIGVLTWKAQDLTDVSLANFADYADYVNPSYGHVDRDLVNRVHELGMGVMTWTVRDVSLTAPLLEAKVDGIITDYPDYVPMNK
ncbi:glycerophosphodiester phosphodiesterase [Bacillus marinisedimentorum]|uniref:glycerophosphodiester phosphodiesterase n=1 Tax=Bacillus marinisedimentorum TaxID=1821260 RepID=UPI0007DFDC2C|nr:glycerophosphodiester phosphodiesterase family protein [Bacillus marinisedimentorum]